MSYHMFTACSATPKWPKKNALMKAFLNICLSDLFAENIQ